MSTAIEEKKISDMTGKELKDLIKDTVLEVVDPDYGLELRPEVVVELSESLKEKTECKGITLDEVKKKIKDRVNVPSDYLRVRQEITWTF